MRNVRLLIATLFVLGAGELCKASYIEDTQERTARIEAITKKAHHLLNQQPTKASLLTQLFKQKDTTQRATFLENLTKCEQKTLNTQTDSGGNSALHYVTLLGDTEAIRILLGKSMVPDTTRDHCGLTPLHYACGQHHIINGITHDALKHIISLMNYTIRHGEAFRTFFEKNVPLWGFTMGKKWQELVMNEALEKFLAQIVCELLEKDAKNNLKNTGSKAIIEDMCLNAKTTQKILSLLAHKKQRLQDNDTSALEALLENRSRHMPLDLIDTEGRTPMMLAAMEQRHRFIDKLLAAGACKAVEDDYSNTADDYLRFYSKDLTNSPAITLEMAHSKVKNWAKDCAQKRDASDIKEQLASIVAALLNCAPNEDGTDDRLFLFEPPGPSTQSIQDSIQYSKTTDQFGESDLFTLIVKRNWPAAAKLLGSLPREKTIELLKEKNCLGLTPLHLLAGSREIINGLMAHAIGLLCYLTDSHTVQTIFSHLGHLATQPLWAFALPTDTKDPYGVVLYIEQLLARMVAEILREKNPMNFICQSEIKNSLSDINFLQYFMFTSLFGRPSYDEEGKEKDYEPFLSMVLVYVPLTVINAQDITGKTPLMYAAINNNEGMATELINQGADLNKTDNAGMTALDWAKMCRHRVIISLIKEALATEEAIRSNSYCPIHDINSLLREHTGFGDYSSTDTDETESDADDSKESSALEDESVSG